MPQKSDRPERGAVWRALLGDPWRKLISVGLATLLWFYLDAQVSSDRTIEVWFHHHQGDASADEVKGAALELQFDEKQYTMVRAFDPDDPARAPIDNLSGKIRLFVKGGKRVVLDLLAAPKFFVKVEPTFRDGRTWIEFTAADVHPVDSRFDGLLRAMAPARVEVDLSRNVKEPLLLGRRDVRVIPPPNVQGFLDRLKWDDVNFAPPDIQVQGPESVVRAYLAHEKPLFVWQPEAPSAGAGGLVQAQLHLDEAAVGVSTVPNIVWMKVPLRAVGHEFKLSNVPVVIVGDAARERFRVEPDHVEVTILAFDILETTLAGSSDEQLREWVATNCMVLAPIPTDANNEGGPILRPELHILRQRPELWTLMFPPTINFTPKSP